MHQIISMIKWIWTSRLSIKISLSAASTNAESSSGDGGGAHEISSTGAPFPPAGALTLRLPARQVRLLRACCRRRYARVHPLVCGCG